MSSRGLLWFGCAAVAAVGLFGIAGADVWWHVRAGEWFLGHGFDGTEPFAYTSERWRYSEVLAQSALAAAHRIGGVTGLVILRAVLLGTLAMVCVRVCRLTDGPRPEPAAVVVSLALMGASVLPVAAMKPQMFAYVVFAVFLGLIFAAEAGRHRLLRWLPVLMVVWANVHRSGILGIGLGIAVAITWALAGRRDAAKARAARILMTGSAVGLLALLVNSGGFFYLSSSFDVLSRDTLRRHVAEWQPLTWELLLDRHAPLLFMFAAWCAERGRRRRLDAEFVVVVVVAVLAVRAGRLAPWLAVALVPGVARLAQVGFSRIRPVFAYVGATAFVVALLGGSYLSSFVPAYRVLGPVPSRVPVALADFLAEYPPPGRMWNDLSSGGYLLYRLGPEIQVSLDGRNDTVYSEAFFETAMRAPYHAADFASVAERYEITVVVGRYRPGVPAYSFLHEDPEWSLVYWDDLYFVLVRQTAQSAGYLHEHSFSELRVHDAMARVLEITQDSRRGELAADIMRNAERSPESMRALYFAALVFHARGQRTEFEATRTEIERMAESRGVAVPPLPGD